MVCVLDTQLNILYRKMLHKTAELLLEMLPKGHLIKKCSIFPTHVYHDNVATEVPNKKTQQVHIFPSNAAKSLNSSSFSNVIG